jgi:hypothetical protein
MLNGLVNITDQNSSWWVIGEYVVVIKKPITATIGDSDVP